MLSSITLILVLMVLVIVTALAFDFINGFHDTANAIATVVSTRVLPPQAAILMAASLNFVGALWSTEVADTIATGLVKHEGVSQGVVLAAVMGAIVWQLATWKYGIPSSSSHALIGGLVGAAMLHAWTTEVVLWDGIFHKVVFPLVASPVAGFVLGFAVMTLIAGIFAAFHPRRISQLFGKLQILTAGGMAFAHGSNDAQKSMGIIAMALLSARLAAHQVGHSGAVEWLETHGVWPAPAAHVDDQRDIPIWVMLSCATAMAIGTSLGGWRIIKTMGHKIIRLEPVHGSAAEVSAAAVIIGASHMGMPVSTTQVISGSIFGVGASKRLSAVRWGVAQGMVVAWVLTLPAAALVSGVVYQVLHWVRLT